MRRITCIPSALLLLASGLGAPGLAACGSGVQDLGDNDTDLRAKPGQKPGPGIDAGSPESGANPGRADAAASATASDPFDPRSCDGPIITGAEAAQKFKAGASKAVLGAYAVYTRGRPCSSLTGCGAWEPTRKVATGVAILFANPQSRKFDLVLADDQSDPRCIDPSLPWPGGISFKDVLAPSMGAYDRMEWGKFAGEYQCKPGYAFGTFGTRSHTGTMTNSCFRASMTSTDPLDNNINFESIILGSF